jgi:hypothetical protein
MPWIFCIHTCDWFCLLFAAANQIRVLCSVVADRARPWLLRQLLASMLLLLAHWDMLWMPLPFPVHLLPSDQSWTSWLATRGFRLHVHLGLLLVHHLRCCFHRPVHRRMYILYLDSSITNFPQKMRFRRTHVGSPSQACLAMIRDVKDAPENAEGTCRALQGVLVVWGAIAFIVGSIGAAMTMRSYNRHVELSCQQAAVPWPGCRGFTLLRRTATRVICMLMGWLPPSMQVRGEDPRRDPA